MRIDCFRKHIIKMIELHALVVTPVERCLIIGLQCIIHLCIKKGGIEFS